MRLVIVLPQWTGNTCDLVWKAVTFYLLHLVLSLHWPSTLVIIVVALEFVTSKSCLTPNFPLPIFYNAAASLPWPTGD